MVISYSNIFTVTNAITHEPITIRVETITSPGGESLVMIDSLEGEYDTQEEFVDVREYIFKELERGIKAWESAVKGWKKDYNLGDKHDMKLFSSMTLKIPGTHNLIDSLKEALEACE